MFISSSFSFVGITYFNNGLLLNVHYYCSYQHYSSYQFISILLKSGKVESEKWKFTSILLKREKMKSEKWKVKRKSEKRLLFDMTN